MSIPGPSTTQTLTPTFRIRINGALLPPQAGADLIAATVQEHVGASGMFTVRLVNWDMARRVITWTDDHLFAEGSQVEVQMGYVDQLATLIVGEITGLEPEFRADEIPTLTVRGYDRGHRLLRGRKTRSFTKTRDSVIAEQIARGVKLGAEVQDTRVDLDYVLQHNQTDREFLEERARRIGYEVGVKDKTLYFRPRQNNTPEVLTLARDADLIEFYPQLTTLTQVGQVTVRGWNAKDKVKIVGQAGAGAESTKMGGSTSGPAATDSAFGATTSASVDLPVSSQSEADQIAQGWFKDMALAYISGAGMCRGRTDLRAGAVVKIVGLGERFSGLYYVTAVTHSYSPAQGYRTAFSVRRNAT